MSLPGVCAVFMLRRGPEGMQVLLGRRTASGRGEVGGIRGSLGPAQDAAEVAIREVRAQVGVRIEASDLQPAGVVECHFPTRRDRSYETRVFVCRRWIGEPAQIDGTAPWWCGLDAVPYARMGEDAARWLPGVLRGGTVDARYTFGADLATVVLTAE